MIGKDKDTLNPRRCLYKQVLFSLFENLYLESKKDSTYHINEITKK